MIDRFEKLTAGTSRIYKSIQRIKKYQMSQFGMKSTHVMCIHYLDTHPDGLTGADLCRLCGEDKSGVSRILSDLEKQQLICYAPGHEAKKYRARALLTDTGKEDAEEIHKLILHATLKGGQGISDTEREIFYRVLFRISENLEQLCMMPDES